MYRREKKKKETYWIVCDRTSSMENSITPLNSLFKRLIIKEISLA
jgi:hypothetical protein